MLNTEEYADELLVYLCALLSGYINYRDEREISNALNLVINLSKKSLYYLAYLELNKFIEFRDIFVGSSTKKYRSLILTGEGPDVVFEPVKEIIKNYPDSRLHIQILNWPDDVKKFLDRYLDAYIHGKLVGSGWEPMFAFDKQKKLFMDLLSQKAEELGSTVTIRTDEYLSLDTKNDVRSSRLLFIHTMFALVRQGVICVENLSLQLGIDEEKSTEDRTTLQMIAVAKVTLLNKENEENVLSAEVRLVGKEVSIWIAELGEVVIRSISRNGSSANFLNYLLSKPDTLITLYMVQTAVKGCSKKDDLTELVRQCGFDKELKRYFFSRCESNRLVFNPSIDMPRQAAETLKQRYDTQS